MLLNKKQQQDAATLLGGAALGIGVSFVVVPGLGGRALGIKPDAAAQAGSNLAVRALGFRDIAIGIGLLVTRKDPAAGKLWRQTFTVSLAGDTGAALLALRKPGANFFTFAAVVSSAGFATLAYLSAQEDN